MLADHATIPEAALPAAGMAFSRGHRANLFAYWIWQLFQQLPSRQPAHRVGLRSGDKVEDELGRQENLTIPKRGWAATNGVQFGSGGVRRPAFFAQAVGGRPSPRSLQSGLLPGFVFFFFFLFLFLLFFLCSAGCAFAQGGPPYYTNDPGTPGPFNWEINLGYMPFFYSDQSVSHTPDVDINFGVGERIQLTYENAWLRVQHPSAGTRFGLGQSNPGVKWRFYDGGESGLSVSIFPQLFLNNPNDAVRRGITPASSAFLLPVEFSRKFGPVDVNYEIGYQFVHDGPDGWLTGLVLGHDFTSKLEGDVELYNQGTFHPSDNQPTIDFGFRYKIHRPVIFLFMAGRSLEPARSNQSYFLGYFGIQLLLPPKSYDRDLPATTRQEQAP